MNPLQFGLRLGVVNASCGGYRDFFLLFSHFFYSLINK